MYIYIYIYIHTYLPILSHSDTPVQPSTAFSAFQKASPQSSHRVEDIRIHIHSICCDANAAGQQLAQRQGANQPWI